MSSLIEIIFTILLWKMILHKFIFACHTKDASVVSDKISLENYNNTYYQYYWGIFYLSLLNLCANFVGRH